MAKSPMRPLLWAMAAARRRLFTASAASSPSPSPSSSSAEARASEVGERKESKPLYRRLSALGRAPAGSVTKTLNKWLREGRTVTATQLMKYVKELRKYNRYSHALELMEWMSGTRGMNISYTNHAIRLDLISKVKGTESAEEYFSQLPEPAKNERTYGSLLNCYCSGKNADKAISLYNHMKDRNIASSTLVHNNLMSLYMKLGQPENAITQFQEMKSKNIVPDNLTCCILMNCYASLNDIVSVESVIKEMEEGGEVTLQWSAYSTLAAIYSSAGMATKAESALKQLEGLVDKRDWMPFHFLISLYAGIGKLGEVKRIWMSLKEVYSNPINMSYLKMLQALSKLDDIHGLKLLYEEWESGYTAYDLRLTNLMIGTYLKKDMIREAESIWQKASERGAVPDFWTCDRFLDYSLKNKDTGLALRWLETATSMVKQDEWKLNEDKVDAFLKAFEEAKDVEGLEEFSKSLRRLKCLDLNAYEALLRTYLAAGKKNPSLHRRIKDDKIKISSETKKLLQWVCATN
ncbi:pentatricopeptide repeat-containing protein At4g01990, mitochondrial-like [Musa acuminata AAA Group]|uniref:pentatricopeptide repeat-containing protein At4g01990, mitochondrial-like n=1 Tax=Musa acuminata AAA Group TaxID=214697 RepID=UPI0031E205F0